MVVFILTLTMSLSFLSNEAKRKPKNYTKGQEWGKKRGGGVTCTMVGETLDLFHAFYSRDFFFFKKQFLARLWTSNHKLAANVLFKH